MNDRVITIIRQLPSDPLAEIKWFIEQDNHDANALVDHGYVLEARQIVPIQGVLHEFSTWIRYPQDGPA